MSMLYTTARHQLRKSPLLKLEALLDFSSTRDLLSPLDELAGARKGGPEGFESLSLACALLLGIWYDLGYEHLATAIRTRVDFQIFCELQPMAPTPSASSLCRFKKRLISLDLYDALLDDVDRQLKARGITIKRPPGALLDLKLRTRKPHDK